LWKPVRARAIDRDMNGPSHHYTTRTRYERLVLSAAMAFVLVFPLFAAPAFAARIEVERGGDTATVTVRGTLESEDGQRFTGAVSGIRKAIVMFSSNGGDLDAGLAIGRAIRHNNFTTGVPAGVQCASACALAWLGGITRYMASSARIGFHAAYVDGKGGPRESGVGNALVGAYLNSLGLAEQAVIYMTSPPPDDIQWLTMEDARQIGIEVAVLTPRQGQPDRTDPSPRLARPAIVKPPLTTETEPSSKPLRPAIVEPSLATRTASRQQALDFIGEYFDHWSDLDARALDYVEGLYGDTVDFYGKPTSPQTIVDMKQQFIERWPIRVYTMRPASILIECDPNGTDCIIKGLVDWECLNPRRGARSAGLSDFVIGATFSPSGDVTVYQEGGKVISKSLDQ
jgi:hypothetical protein